MKKIFLIAAICCIASSVSAQSTTCQSKDYIEVYGYSEKKVLPDIAYISITLNEKDPATAAVGVAEMEKRMKKSLLSLGINIEKQLSIENITSQFAKRKNIDLSNIYTLELTNLSLLQEVFDKLEDHGISNIYIKEYKISNINDIKLSLKTLAIKDAKKKAEAIAAGAEVKIGGMIQATDQDRGQMYNEYIPRMTSSFKTSEDGDDSNENLPNLKVKEIKVSSTINTRWFI